MVGGGGGGGGERREIAQWSEGRDERSRAPSPGRSGGRTFFCFLLRGQLSVLTLISVSVPPPCYRSGT